MGWETKKHRVSAFLVGQASFLEKQPLEIFVLQFGGGFRFVRFNINRKGIKSRILSPLVLPNLGDLQTVSSVKPSLHMGMYGLHGGSHHKVLSLWCGFKAIPQMAPSEIKAHKHTFVVPGSAR